MSSLSRLMCVNCGLCVNSICRHVVFEQDSRVISLISERISPVIITENDYICQACLDAVVSRLNTVDDGETLNKLPSSLDTLIIGHIKVCIMCGCSVLIRRTQLVLRDNPSDLHQNIATIVLNSIMPRELTTTDRICMKCWMKTKRTAQKMEQSDIAEKMWLESLPNSDTRDELTEVKTEPIEEPPTKIQPLEVTYSGRMPELILLPLSTKSSNTTGVVNTPEQRPSNNVGLAPVQVANVTLENYRRASNTGSHCVFSLCTKRDLHRVSDQMRARLVAEHKFYLPVHVRICSAHLLSDKKSWDTLYKSKNSTATFTVKQIEHIFSFINPSKRNIIDFDDPLSIDNQLFQYWFGLSKEKFCSILSDIPQIQATHRGVTGLAAHLIKLRNKDSGERIANLMGIPRRTLDGLMSRINKILIDVHQQIELTS